MMMSIQYNPQKMKELKSAIIKCNLEPTNKDLLVDLQKQYKNFPIIPLLLMMQQLIVNEPDITQECMEYFLNNVSQDYFDEKYVGLTDEHPLGRLFKENERFRKVMGKLDEGLSCIEQGWDETYKQEMIDAITTLGQFHHHYHVKEKLIFPILEKYGHFTPTRIIWKADDRIRGLYQGTKNMILKTDVADAKDIKLMYHLFAEAFNAMLFQEEKFLFPIIMTLFKEHDWHQIAVESSAYGYTFAVQKTDNQPQNVVDDRWETENIPFGSGFLTVEEANLILNHLPVEITFVDRNSIFKYFNNIVRTEEMMLIRTPLSIGRNVANCHPPKSLSKVMTLVRDLKSRRRKSESMWFKKGEAYVHITYKALFNGEDQFIGILEYVQDIGSFFDLPKEVKRELTPLD